MQSSVLNQHIHANDWRGLEEMSVLSTPSTAPLKEPFPPVKAVLRMKVGHGEKLLPPLLQGLVQQNEMRWSGMSHRLPGAMQGLWGAAKHNHRTQREPKLEETQRITKSNPWLHVALPKPKPCI